MTAVTTWVEDARQLEREWDDLATRTKASPFVRPGWLLAWDDAFGRRPLQAVAARRNGRLCGILPLQRRGGFASSPTNWHSPDFDLLAEDESSRAALLHAALSAAPWRLALSFVDARTACDVAASAGPAGRPAVSRVIERSPYVTLTGTFADYRSALPRKALKEVQRRRRRLQEQGKLSLVVHHEADPVLLDRFMGVEGSGWKTARGTALHQEPATRVFYERVADWAAQQGWLRLLLLTLDGRVLAGDLALQVAGTHYLLKTGYDPAYRSFGPGKLLRLLVLETVFEERLESYEFLGDSTPWKAEWTETVRERHRVCVFGAGHRGLTRLEVPAREGLRRVRPWRAR